MRTKAVKNDSLKPRMDLLPSYPLEEVACVLGFGAEKYGDHNWRHGMVWSRLYASALRHLLSWNAGEDKDPETGRSHLAHACCCLLFLLQYERDHPHLDNRFKSIEE